MLVKFHTLKEGESFKTVISGFGIVNGIKMGKKKSDDGKITNCFLMFGEKFKFGFIPAENMVEVR